MKLNNKGFAISSIMYLILVLALIVVSITLVTLSNRRIVLDKLKSLGMEIYRTYWAGTIIVKSNGTDIKVEKVKTDTNGEEKWNM